MSGTKIKEISKMKCKMHSRKSWRDKLQFCCSSPGLIQREGRRGEVEVVEEKERRRKRRRRGRRRRRRRKKKSSYFKRRWLRRGYVLQIVGAMLFFTLHNLSVPDTRDRD